MLLGNPDDADEVSQEVFLKMLGQREHGPEPADWRAWLTRVAINACHDRHRSGWWKWWKRDGRELLDTDLTSRDTVHEAISHEQTDALWRAFRKLTPRQQEVFILRQVEGWSTREDRSRSGALGAGGKTATFSCHAPFARVPAE